MVGNDFVVFDVLGSRIRLSKKFMQNYPTSLFADILADINNVEKCAVNLPEELIKMTADEYYVQRSPESVRIVFQYLVTQKLHVPPHVCREHLLEEFAFWRVHPTTTCDDCAGEYEDIFCHVKEEEYEVYVESGNKCANIRAKLWALLEHPSSSIFATVFNVLSLFFILLSVVNVILASMPELQFCKSMEPSVDEMKAVIVGSNRTIFLDSDCVGTKVFFVIDAISIAWFTLEVILRVLACPSLKRYFTSPLNIIDICVILPFYVELLIADIHSRGFYTARAVLMFFRILRVVRIFRIFKLARYSTSLRVLAYTVKSAKKELCMFAGFILLATVIFANFLYQLEKEVEGTHFTSIPASFWWCIVTLTTVGYGDVYPQTVAGKIFGSITCVCGIVVIAFPVAVLVDKFLSIYKKYINHPHVNLNQADQSPHNGAVSPKP